MIESVLVPMDDSEMAERALAFAFEAHPDAEVTVLNVVGEPSTMMGQAMSLAIEDDIKAAAEEHAEGVLDRARAIADDHARDISTEVAWGRPSKAILNRADEYDTVVVGSHGGSIADRLLVGNVAETIFRRSPVPVTVVR
ncbi:universal stress protein [Halococcoides cellulosivorans]|uniref:Universal stress protein n=1 Tax=Halococcoides cellulosivorans TaxID=1679096 RepID=A0A2R4X0D8_9EURY|nr:universal stress protein [Halococcoides cellulosivorans]AWB27246.1 universal stress protein [Halococcoides cellulosivorans]